jgi:hypothetical protein
MSRSGPPRDQHDLGNLDRCEVVAVGADREGPLGAVASKWAVRGVAPGRKRQRGNWHRKSIGGRAATGHHLWDREDDGTVTIGHFVNTQARTRGPVRSEAQWKKVSKQLG